MDNEFFTGLIGSLMLIGGFFVAALIAKYGIGW